MRRGRGRWTTTIGFTCFSATRQLSSPSSHTHLGLPRMMQSIHSPDTDVFSTPPSTPRIQDLPPSLRRRTSRPSNLRIQHSAPDFAPNIVLDQQQSPDLKRASLGTGPDASLTQPTTPSLAAIGRPHHRASPNTATSPYFVHSQLQGASIQDFLHATTKCKDARMEHAHPHAAPYSAHSSDFNDLDDDYDSGSLTRQLAETAVGVREMSKQLGESSHLLAHGVYFAPPLLAPANHSAGRARVHSHIHTVLIVTKARDNRLIKLTRELALFLMHKPTHTGRGLVVYVDAQLRTSRRFDAAGMQRAHPELFVPFPRRRESGSSAGSTPATENGDASPHAMGEGQLRYWTADMCSRSPHLFDFVVTVSSSLLLTASADAAPHSSEATAPCSSPRGSSSGSSRPCCPLPSARSGS